MEWPFALVVAAMMGSDMRRVNTILAALAFITPAPATAYDTAYFPAYQWLYSEWKDMDSDAKLHIAAGWLMGYQYGSDSKQVVCTSIHDAVQSKGPEVFAILMDSWPLLVEHHNSNVPESEQRIASSSMLNSLVLSNAFQLIIQDYCRYEGQANWDGTYR